jgi:hypothetical protein
VLIIIAILLALILIALVYGGRMVHDVMMFVVKLTCNLAILAALLAALGILLYVVFHSPKAQEIVGYCLIFFYAWVAYSQRKKIYRWFKNDRDRELPKS